MRATGLLLAGLALLAVGVIGLVLLGTGWLPVVLAGGSPVDRSLANGARIFQTGIDLDGRPIPYSGGMMMRTGCAGCHGADGRGLRTPMFVSPDITYQNLTDPNGMVEPDGERGPTYTDELIRRAVTQGIDAEGKPLAWPMPRWRLSDQDWSDLLAYLKTLR